MHAPKKSSVPVLEKPEQLLEYDAVLFGIPTRYGNFPAQWKTFWDRTGGIWATGGFYGRYAGLFVSTGTLGGGQESTALASMSTLSHHGFIYVPLGYKTAFPLLSNLDEVHGGSAWGAGTFAVRLSCPEKKMFRELETDLLCYRVPMALASPLLSSSRSPRPRASPSGTTFLVLTSRDCMAAGRTSPGHSLLNSKRKQKRLPRTKLSSRVPKRRMQRGTAKAALAGFLRSVTFSDRLAYIPLVVLSV